MYFLIIINFLKLMLLKVCYLDIKKINAMRYDPMGFNSIRYYAMVVLCLISDPLMVLYIFLYFYLYTYI